MSDHHRDVQRGIEAAQVLENPAFKDALADLRQTAVDHMISQQIADTEGQRHALMFVKVVDKFEQLLLGRIQAGRFAEHVIEDEKERKKGLLRRALHAIG